MRPLDSRAACGDKNDGGGQWCEGREENGREWKEGEEKEEGEKGEREKTYPASVPSRSDGFPSIGDA